MSGLSDPARHGFTLLEVLVSVLVLAIGIAVVLRAFDLYLFALMNSSEQLRATELLEQKVAELRRAALCGESVDGGYASGRFTEDERYQWEARWSGLATGARQQRGRIIPMALDQVSLRVWREGGLGSYTLTTVLRREGEATP